jgi:hypothetical protein
VPRVERKSFYVSRVISLLDARELVAPRGGFLISVKHQSGTHSLRRDIFARHRWILSQGGRSAWRLSRFMVQRHETSPSLYTQMHAHIYKMFKAVLCTKHLSPPQMNLSHKITAASRNALPRHTNTKRRRMLPQGCGINCIFCTPRRQTSIANFSWGDMMNYLLPTALAQVLTH